ncbi:hypothetical protein, partial [Bradyrhizobium sp. SZCCHNRI3043]|uniref:hypothetical protein n=1 Tax=Bradyrhizobium sp. SZCCHNRI3043 TaxID=3057292 RepID=UPI0028E7D412
SPPNRSKTLNHIQKSLGIAFGHPVARKGEGSRLSKGKEIVSRRRRRQHSSHAQIARRATLSHAADVASSGKSPAHFRTSLLPHEGRFATVTNRWQWDAMGVCCCSVVATRTNSDTRTVKSRGPDIPMLISSGC